MLNCNKRRGEEKEVLCEFSIYCYFSLWILMYYGGQVDEEVSVHPLSLSCKGSSQFEQYR